MYAEVIMIELTREQLEQLGAGRAVEVTDPQTATAYVVLRKDAYERVKALVYDDSEWTHEEMLAQLAHNIDSIWDGPGMDAYDRYDEERAKRCP
jgi:hypothetical protein